MSYRFLQVVFVGCLSSTLLLSACSSSDSSSVEDFPIVYVKRKIDRAGENNDRPLTSNAGRAFVFNGGGNLYIRQFSSPTAPERNITGQLPFMAAVEGVKTAGDVSDPDISYDGRYVVFALHEGMYEDLQDEDQPTWNIWIYDLQNPDEMPTQLNTGVDPEAGNDVDPHFLPDGRIVFSSDRLIGTRTQILDWGDDASIAVMLHEKRQRGNILSTLHVVDINGENLKQISYNQSHDRNPSVLSNGKIVYSRWDHMGPRNEFNLYTVNPDGSGFDLLYGAHSHDPTVSEAAFLHPREMQDGRIMTTVEPLSGTDEGGDLVIVDYKKFREYNISSTGAAQAQGGGQVSVSNGEVTRSAGLSVFGRYTTPYPLWDGAQRALVSWSPCRMMQATTIADPNGGDPIELPFPAPQDIVIKPCTKDNINDPNLQEAPSWYGIYMLDLSENTKRPIVVPEEGYIITDPIPVLPRTFATTPPVIPDLDREQMPFALQETFDRQMGIINIRSVYDTMGCDPALDSPLEPRRGCANPDAGVSGLTADERNSIFPPEDITNGILRKTVKVDPLTGQFLPDNTSRGDAITRTVADIEKIRDPKLYTAEQRVARFVRVSMAAPTTEAVLEADINAFGNSGAYEMQYILGYAEVEPDGSVYVEVPANKPVALTVLDGAGRAIVTHNAWLQVVPGEVRQCPGCHAPPGQQSINPGAPEEGVPFPHTTGNVLIPHLGETMAETRARTSCVADNCNYQLLKRDILYTDVWTDPTTAERAFDPPITMTYLDSDSSDALNDGLLTNLSPVNADSPTGCANLWAKNCRITINYEEHIHPLWTVTRPADLDGDGNVDSVNNVAVDYRCATCHDAVDTDPVTMMDVTVVPAGNLNLADGVGDNGLFQSFNQLRNGRNTQEVINGVLVDKIIRDPVTGDPVLDANGNTQLVDPPRPTMIAGSTSTARHSTLVRIILDEQTLANSTLDHSRILTPREKRLIIE